MKKVINITTAKHKLLKIIAELEEDIIITKDYQPVAVLSPMSRNTAQQKPALIVLAARQCDHHTRMKSITVINGSAKLFNKTVVVYSRETEPYLREFDHHNLLAIKTEKKEHPIVTSLKAGIACLEGSDTFFMFSFLNKPITRNTFLRLTTAIKEAETEKKGIIIPVSEGKPSHPLIFSTRYKANIIKIRKELGIPHIIKRHKEDILYIDIEA
jgi:CTP:molybdopterin cytidylyltransferase MocA